MGKSEEELFTNENMGPWEHHVNEMTKSRAYPMNEYEHGAYLIDSDQDGLTEFSQLVDRAIQLANISDDTLMRLEQNSAALLVNFFDMTRREPGLRSFFLIRYHEWRSEILLTKTKDGNERKHQATIGTKYVPKGQMTGYSGNFEEETENEDLDFLKKLIPRKR